MLGVRAQHRQLRRAQGCSQLAQPREPQPQPKRLPHPLPQVVPLLRLIPQNEYFNPNRTRLGLFA